MLHALDKRNKTIHDFLFISKSTMLTEIQIYI